MSEMKITDLNEELLENIFSYFVDTDDEEAKDNLRNLTMTCKTFNEIISSSVKLMYSFEIYWNKIKQNDRRLFLRSSRKYRKVVLSENFKTTPTLLKFLTLHSTTITELAFFNCKITTSELKSILNATEGKLKDLYFIFVYFDEDKGVTSVNLPELSLLWFIQCDGYFPVLNYFESSNKIKNFVIESHHQLLSGEAKVLADFLVNLVDLKTLNMDNYLFEKIFEDNYFTNNAKFNLKKLYVYGNGSVANNDIQENFMNFLNGQCDSLQLLFLYKFVITNDLMNLILGMKLLKDLLLSKPKFSLRKKLKNQSSSIKTLVLKRDYERDIDTGDERAICDVLSCCPNTNNLMVILYNISGISSTIVNRLKNLEELSIIGCRFHPFICPSVKKLYLGCIHDNDIILYMLQCNRQLKQVFLPTDIQNHPDFPHILSELNIELVRFHDQL